MKIEQVPMWLVLRQSGHALVQTKSGWHYTACGTLTPNGDKTERRPSRICGRCRAALTRARLLYIQQRPEPN